MEKKKLNIITMRDAPAKTVITANLSKPMTTHDLFKPKSDFTKDPKEPGGPMITTGNVDKVKEQSEMRARMEKARTAKMEKIKEELQAKRDKKEKAEAKKKAKKDADAKKAEKKEPESPPEPITEEAETSDIDKYPPLKEKYQKKSDPLKEAVDKAKKTTSTRKSYTTKKKEEPKEEK